MIGWFIVPPNCGCGCRMIAIGAFFCRAGWYRPSMRPAGPVKMISGMAIDLGPGLPRREAAAGCVVAWLHLLNGHLVWNYSNYTNSAVPSLNTRYKGRAISGF